MTDEAAPEWALVVGPPSPRRKFKPAHLASRWGWYAQTIATWRRPANGMTCRCLSAALCGGGGERHQGNPGSGRLLFAIMRQESLFEKDAVSRADARGLMQMQPATAAAVARRWHVPPPARDSLSSLPWH